MSLNLNNKEKSSKFNNQLFNSKLFFDLDNKSNDNDNDTYESDNSFEINEIESKNNNDYFLLNDLIKQLDYSYPISEEKEKNQNSSSYNFNQNLFNKNDSALFSLNYTGYDFYPKNFIFNNLIMSDKNKTKKKHFKERKGDWVCIICNNLNFAFRSCCNICKSLKVNSVKKII